MLVTNTAGQFLIEHLQTMLLLFSFKYPLQNLYPLTITHSPPLLEEVLVTSVAIR